MTIHTFSRSVSTKDLDSRVADMTMDAVAVVMLKGKNSSTLGLASAQFSMATSNTIAFAPIHGKSDAFAGLFSPPKITAPIAKIDSVSPVVAKSASLRSGPGIAPIQ